MPYEECRPPNMNLIFTLTQPENFGAIDTWPNLISTLQISDNKVYIIYKGEDHHVCLIMFEDLCFIWKRTFKIMYARSATITALRLEDGDKQKFSDG